jgi:hypothetical protein
VEDTPAAESLPNFITQTPAPLVNPPRNSRLSQDQSHSLRIKPAFSGGGLKWMVKHTLLIHSSSEVSECLTVCVTMCLLKLRPQGPEGTEGEEGAGWDQARHPLHGQAHSATLHLHCVHPLLSFSLGCGHLPFELPALDMRRRAATLRKPARKSAFHPPDRILRHLTHPRVGWRATAGKPAFDSSDLGT